MAAAPRSALMQIAVGDAAALGAAAGVGLARGRKSSARRAPSRKRCRGWREELREEVGGAGVARQRVVEAVGFVDVGGGRVLVAEAAVVVEVAQEVAAAGDGAVAQRLFGEARAGRVAAHDRQDGAVIGGLDGRVGAEAEVRLRARAKASSSMASCLRAARRWCRGWRRARTPSPDQLRAGERVGAHRDRRAKGRPRDRRGRRRCRRGRARARARTRAPSGRGSARAPPRYRP